MIAAAWHGAVVWLHKRGSSPVSYLDALGKIITDPTQAALGVTKPDDDHTGGVLYAGCKDKDGKPIFLCAPDKGKK